MLEQCITSFVNGRVRLRHDALCDPDTVAQLKSFLPTIAGVQEVSVNIHIGSLLLVYDADIITKDDLHDMLRKGAELLNLSQETETKDLAKPSKKSSTKTACVWKSCPVRRPLNQALLLTMGGTMVFAYVGSKQVHIIAGWLFMGFNAYHIWKRRKLL